MTETSEASEEIGWGGCGCRGAVAVICCRQLLTAGLLQYPLPPIQQSLPTLQHHHSTDENPLDVEAKAPYPTNPNHDAWPRRTHDSARGRVR